MQLKTATQKSVCALIAACSVSMAAQGQVIDPLTGSVSGYTTTLVLDNSHGVDGVSFTTSGSGLSANYSGSTAFPEQALFLAPAASFSSIFAVGDTLSVSTAIPASTTAMDFGLAISSASPVAAGAGNSYNSRPNFDWASISIRPSQTALRVNTSISGAVNTSGGVIGISAASVTGLYITWVSADVFNLGYMTTSGSILDESVTFASGSTIGTDIGFYGDMRATGTSLGTISNLTVVPEPSTLALSAMGFAGLFAIMRLKQRRTV